MANLKRLRDTENKMIVWAIPTAEPYKKLQVWTNDDWSKLYVYRNSQYIELDTSNNSVVEYWHVWKTLDDETVGYYLTNEPTNLYNRDEWDDVTYTFKDYDWTVLKTGKIEEGETPTPPADPTRSATAQYTYTFAGWNPTVWPISKKTTYTATYTATVNKYTITATSSDTDLWTVSPASVANVEYGTALTVADNVITVGTWESAPTITATAGEGWEFVSWWEVPATVTGNTSVEATFSTPALSLMNSTYWIEDSWTNSLVLFFDGVWDYSQLVNIVVNRSEDAVTWDVSYDFTNNVHEDTPQGINSVSYIFSCVSSDDLDVLLQWDSASVDGTVCTFTSEAMTYINAVYNTSWEEDPDEDTTCQALLTYLEWVAWQGQSILVLPNAEEE